MLGGTSFRASGSLGFFGLPEQPRDERFRDAVIERLVAAERLTLPLDEVLHLRWICVAERRIRAANTTVVVEETARHILRLNLSTGRLHVLTQDVDPVLEIRGVSGEVAAEFVAQGLEP